ncbi:MAG: F0F1 ATP synthase subunit gamma [Novosphingobium sp.]|nr:F0F1 ATP synthase subunit gamma [Novosphingobium sp.]
MTERLSEIEERIDSVGQLSSVVGAIRGIAAARLREGQDRLDGVRAYAEAVAVAIGEALALLPQARAPAVDDSPEGSGLIIALCSEQGFVGAYNSRVLDAAGALANAAGTKLFVIGDHGLAVTNERGLDVAWSAPMAVHADETTELANRLADLLYDEVGRGARSATIVHAAPATAGEPPIVERSLIPFDFDRFPAARLAEPPLLTLPPEDLLAQLAEEYVFAELCEACVIAFAAENEARMRAMISAHENVASRLDDLKASARRRRQEEITSEVVELAAGVEAARLR